MTDQSPITITDTLPAGLEVSDVELFAAKAGLRHRQSAGLRNHGRRRHRGEHGELHHHRRDRTEIRAGAARPGPGDVALEIKVKVPPSAAGSLLNRVEVEGGGAETAVAETENQASAEDPPAGFEEFQAELTGADGKPASAADSHPYQYTTSFAVNLETAPPGARAPFLPAEGDLKEIEVALPPGLVGNPTATPRCSAQQFTTHHFTVSPVRDNSHRLQRVPDRLGGGGGVGAAAGRGSLFQPGPDLQPRPAQRHAGPARLRGRPTARSTSTPACAATATTGSPPTCTT